MLQGMRYRGHQLSGERRERSHYSSITAYMQPIGHVHTCCAMMLWAQRTALLAVQCVLS